MYDFAESQLNTQFCAKFSAVRRHETIIGRYIHEYSSGSVNIKLVEIPILWYILL